MDVRVDFLGPPHGTALVRRLISVFVVRIEQVACPAWGSAVRMFDFRVRQIISLVVTFTGRGSEVVCNCLSTAIRLLPLSQAG